MKLIHGCVIQTAGGEMIIRLSDGRKVQTPCKKGITYGDPVKVAWDYHNNTIKEVYTMAEARKETMYQPDEAALKEPEVDDEDYPFSSEDDYAEADLRPQY
jgi:hypothetical protein